MPKAGTVQVRLTSWHAAAVSRWILSEKVQGALEAGGGPHRPQIPLLESLAIRLSISARRRHKKRLFTIPIPREEAHAFARIRWPTLQSAAVIDPSGIVAAGLYTDPLVKTAHRRFLAVLVLTKGRRALSRGSIQRRLAPGYKLVGDRQRKALRAREKNAFKWHDFYANMARRGETILTTSLPFPNFP